MPQHPQILGPICFGLDRFGLEAGSQLQPRYTEEIPNTPFTLIELNPVDAECLGEMEFVAYHFSRRKFFFRCGLLEIRHRLWRDVCELRPFLQYQLNNDPSEQVRTYCKDGGRVLLQHGRLEFSNV